jgi:uncharacterized membrane protein
MPWARQPTESLGGAALLGGAAGLRSFTPLAALAVAGRLGGRPWVTRGIPLLAVGELIGDKLPSTPARTALGPLVGRAACGALAGTVVGGRRGAVAGAAAAVAAAFAGQHGRAALVRATGRPDAVIATGEDVLALALARLGSR